MRHIVIDQKDTRLEVIRGNLILSHPAWDKPKRVPLTHIDSLIIQSPVNLTSHVLSQMVEHGSRVQIMPTRGQGESACVVGSWHNDAVRRIYQYRACTSQTQQAYWARHVVALRLRSQQLMLQKAILIRHDLMAALSHGSRQLTLLARQLPNYQQVEQLRGVEGAATAQYFKAYRQLFGGALQFQERNRRPPRDPVNVLLSLGATLLHGLCRQAVHAAGLDPQLGALHEIAFGRDSLVCDLMELQRADLEFWVWRQFATENIRLEDFSFSSAPNQLPCLLGKAGRSRFYAAFAAIQTEWLKQAQKNCWVLVKRLQRQEGKNTGGEV